MSIEWIGGMLTIGEAQLRTELFLTDQMLEALHAVEYELPSFDTQLHDVVGGTRASRSAMCAALPMPPTSSTPSAKSC